MTRVLIAYATTEGHTRKIAGRVANWAEARGYGVTVVDTADLPAVLDFQEYDAFILAGSIHQTKHQSSLVHFVREHLQELQAKPSAFLSVSLSATVEDEHHQADANKCIDTFLAETGWTPTERTPVAGALLYTKYDFFKRFIMRMISKSEGGDVDTSRDYEYTNWPKLEGFVLDFLEKHVRLRASPQLAWNAVGPGQGT